MAVVPTDRARATAVPSVAPLNTIADRVLWLSMLMVHHANKVRPNLDTIKVGHHASSASIVEILTSLFFDFMRPGDRISIKPHASPVLRASHYLMANLDVRYLTMLRDHHGLQAYPSQTKDSDLGGLLDRFRWIGFGYAQLCCAGRPLC